MTLAEERTMKIAAFSADLWDHVCPAIRLVEPIAQAGMELMRGNDWKDGAFQVSPQVILDADLVVMQRDFPRHVEAYERVVALARQLQKPLIYELDDLLVEVGSSHPDADHYLAPRPSILRAVLEADAITVSTQPLQEYLQAFHPNVFRLPNYLADRLWQPCPPRPARSGGAPVRIGYMGGQSHQADMEIAYPALERILARFGEGVELQFWGLHPGEEWLRRPNVRWTHPYLVSYAEFAGYFVQQDCDIFIAPLQDNLFNRCKSSLKYLEYSFLGVPGVYSKLAPFEELVIHGENGFLADTAGEWEACLAHLVEDPALRQRMGSAAQETVRQNWLLSRNARHWEETYTQVLALSRESQALGRGQSLPVVKKIQRWYIDLAEASARLKEKLRQQQARLDDLARQSAQQQQGFLQERQEFLRERQQYLQEMQSLQERIEALNQKVSLLERKAGELEKNADLARQELIQKSQQLNAALSMVAQVQGSTAWKLVQFLFRARLALAPTGSLRERLFRKMVAAARIWRHQGFRAVLAAAFRQRGQGAQPAATAAPSVAVGGVRVVAVDGVRCPQPAVSAVLVRWAGDPTPLQVEAAHAWLDKQTWPGWELVIWDQAGGKAWEASHPEQAWPAADVTGLKMGLAGKYLCVISADLLRQDETFLESNLLALESESLVFTVNLNAPAEWARPSLAQGLLPYGEREPLQRMLAQTRCVGEDFSIELGGWLELHGGRAAVAGKVIWHTTTELELEGRLQFNRPPKGAATRLVENLLVAQAEGSPVVEDVPHAIHPVDTVLPVFEAPAEKPTVLVFMPFLAVGGAERVALDMIRCLGEEIRFVVLTLDPHDPAIGTTVNAFRRQTPYVYTAHDFLDRNLSYSLVHYLIQRYQPATLYIANGSPWIYDALATIQQNHPGLRLANQVYDHQAGWINRYDPVLARILDANIGVNQKICDAFRDKGVRPEAIYRIENGVNTAEFDPRCYDPARVAALKQKLGIDPAKKVVAFMARLHPQKRPLDFVEVARRFSGDPALCFLMVGDGPLAKTTDEEIARIGLQNMARLPFYQPSRDIFALSDVYVLPSEYEGMPMVLLEAQAMGKPVVVTDVGNNRDVLEITQGGVLVEKIGDIGALRQGILSMLAAPPEPLKVRQAIVDNFSLELMGRKYRAALLGK